MKKIPDFINILGFDFKITKKSIVDNTGYTLGHFDLADRSIVIQSDLNNDEAMSVFYHEIGEIIIRLNWNYTPKLTHGNYTIFMNMFYDTLKKAGLI